MGAPSPLGLALILLTGCTIRSSPIPMPAHADAWIRPDGGPDTSSSPSLAVAPPWSALPLTGLVFAPDLVIDQTGVLHISASSRDGSSFYVRVDGADVLVERATSTPATSFESVASSIALDGTGDVRIVADVNDFGMHLATRSGARWTIQDLAFAPNGASDAIDVALAVDGGSLRVFGTLVEPSGASLAVSDGVAPPVAVAPLEGGSACGRMVALVTRSGWTHVTCNQGYPMSLLSRSPTGTWTGQHVASFGVAIAQAPDGRVHVFADDHDLGGSEWIADEAGSGITQRADLPAGHIADAAIDAEGFVHLAMFTRQGAALQVVYATDFGGAWHTVPVGPLIDDDRDSGPVIGLMPDGAPVIVLVRELGLWAVTRSRSSLAHL